MNVEHLKLFVRVASTHNISLAGAEFGLSAAVSSAYINKLEARLGVKLLHRTTRKVSLTQEGIDFLPHAEEVLSAVDMAQASVGSGSYLPQGTLRITSSASFGRMHIVPALKQFMALYPDLKVDLRLSDSIVDMVEGGFDIAIRNAALNDSTLIARKLARDKRMILASPEYIAQFGEPYTPEDIQQHGFIRLAGLDHLHFGPAKNVERVKLNGALKVDNGEAARDACVQGMGLAVSSLWCAYQEVQSKRLVPVLTDYPLVAETAIWAVYPSSRLLAPKVRVFIDYLADYFGEQPYWEAES